MEKDVLVTNDILEDYEILTSLDHDENVFLVIHPATRKVFIEKITYVYNKSLFKMLEGRTFKGIPQIHVFKEIDGKALIIEDYIHGRNLHQLISEKGPLSENEVSSLMFSLCEILDQFHSLTPPVIHRDIKPENIILSQDSVLYLIDFNISREFNPSSDQDTVAIVSHHFSAPELYGFGQSDQRSDIYSIGATMHFLLTGGYLKEVEYSGSLKDIISKCIAIDPENRYQNLDSLKIDLEKANPSLIKSRKSDPSYPDISHIPEEPKKEVTYTGSYRIPGFRSGNSLHMFLSLLGYGCLSVLCFTLNIKTTTTGSLAIVDLWVERIAVFIFFLSAIFIIFNYRDWQTRLPLIRKMPSRILGIILFLFLEFSILLTILVMFVSLLSSLQ